LLRVLVVLGLIPR